MDLSRSDMERMVRPVIERCRAPVEQAFADVGVTPKDVDRVVFLGGLTRMPVVRSYCEDLFSRKAEPGVVRETSARVAGRLRMTAVGQRDNCSSANCLRYSVVVIPA